MNKNLAIICAVFSLTLIASCANIHKAVNSGDVIAVETALSEGENVNKTDREGNTPLMIAARHGDLGIAQTLIKKGADVKARNKDGFDALALLSNYSMPGAPVPGKSNQPAEPIGIATEGHVRTAAYLINEGAELNGKINDGSTALILAAQLNKAGLVELLLSRGADVNATNLRGRTALIIAVFKGQGEVICPLIRHGADANAKDSEGITVLQYAEQFGRQKIFQLLKGGCPSVSGSESKEQGDNSLKLTNKKMAEMLVVEKLIESLKDQDHSVRSEAARRLGELKDTRSVVPLIVSLADEHPYTRRRAAVSLGNLRDLRAVEPLIKALGDEDAFVQKYAAGALVEITGQKFGNDVKKWQEWWSNRIRQN
jgi:ankyrin repeat protein